MARKLYVMVGMMMLLAPCWATAASPEGWFLAGSDPGSYQIERDTTVTHEGKNSGKLASTATSKGFGTMMQSSDPGEYLGKRVRMSAFVKSKDVKRWAGLWMRVDGDGDKSHVLSFDNMQDRPIQGSLDWKRYEIVLDVPAQSKSFSFGILVDGPGTVWISDVRFDIVDPSVATTGSKNREKQPKPANLNFDK
jgi:hypothetical protein